MPIVPQNVPKPQQSRTEVGVRSLDRSGQAPTLKKGQRGRGPKGAAGPGSRALDRVSREEENRLVDEVSEEQKRRRGRGFGDFKDLSPAPGHAKTLIRRSGRAFRLDDEGRDVPPHFSDVEQGNLHDAWLLALLAAVAHAQPGALIERVQPQDDGDFKIRLGDRIYPVSPEFPSEGYAEPEPQNRRDTLWVALFEKAFALDSACSYGEIETGNPSRVFPLLVEGRSARRRVRMNGESNGQFEQMRAYHASDLPMLVISKTSKVRAPFVADHAYAVVGVDGEGNVKLYNPWGTRRGSRPLDAVLHEVPWTDARAAFEFLYVGGLSVGGLSVGGLSVGGLGD